MTFTVYQAIDQPSAIRVPPGTPVSLQLDELNGLLPVYLTGIAQDHRDEIAAVIATLDKTPIGAGLLQEMRACARANAISIVEWHPEQAALPDGTWFYRRDGAQYEHRLSPKTDLRRHAGLIFDGLVSARNALMEKLRRHGKPLKAVELQTKLNRQLGDLRQLDTLLDDFGGLLSAHVASDIQAARPSVMQRLVAISNLAEGQQLLQQLKALRDLGVMPVIDANPHQLDHPGEPDGIPIWDPCAANNDAVALETLTDVRNRLVKVAAELNSCSEEKIERKVGIATKASGRQDALNDVMTMILTPAAENVRIDVEYDLREIQRTPIGRWLIAVLQQQTKAGHVIVLDNGPVTGPRKHGGKPVWVYSRRLLEARSQQHTGLTSEQMRLCVAFSDLMTLADMINEKQNAHPVLLPADSLSRVFRDELRDLPGWPASAGVRAPASAASQVAGSTAPSIPRPLHIDHQRLPQSAQTSPKPAVVAEPAQRAILLPPNRPPDSKSTLETVASKRERPEGVNHHGVPDERGDPARVLQDILRNARPPNQQVPGDKASAKTPPLVKPRTFGGTGPSSLPAQAAHAIATSKTQPSATISPTPPLKPTPSAKPKY